MSKKSPKLGTIWITGAGSGIGEAMARRLVKEGYSIALSARSPDSIKKLADEFTENGGTARAFPMDITDRTGVEKTAQEIVEWQGGIEVLCNNAGLNTPKRRWDEIDFAQWDAIFETNIKGSINVIAAVLPGMRAQGGGLLLHTSSWAGRFSAPVAGVPYGASKHALSNLSATLNAQEGVHGIRSTALHPGEVATPLLLKRPGFDPALAERMIQPQDMAELALTVIRMNPNVAIHEITLAPVQRNAV